MNLKANPNEEGLDGNLEIEELDKEGKRRENEQQDLMFRVLDTRRVMSHDVGDPINIKPTTKVSSLPSPDA